MRRHSIVLAAAVLAALLGASLPAAADELPPPTYPSGLPKPGDIGNDIPDGGYTPGPTIVITPGSEGSDLPAPTTSLPGAPTTDPAAPTGTPTVTGTPAVVEDAAGTDPPRADGGSPVWLAYAAGGVGLVALFAAFGGVLRRRVTRDAASR